MLTGSSASKLKRLQRRIPGRQIESTAQPLRNKLFRYGPQNLLKPTDAQEKRTFRNRKVRFNELRIWESI